MKSILASGVTGILVSHSIPQVRELCNKILWLDHGRQLAFSDQSALVCDAYEEFLITKRAPEGEAEIEALAAAWQARKERERKAKEKSEQEKLLDLLKNSSKEAAVRAARAFLAEEDKT